MKNEETDKKIAFFDEHRGCIIRHIHQTSFQGTLRGYSLDVDEIRYFVERDRVSPGALPPSKRGYTGDSIPQDKSWWTTKFSLVCFKHVAKAPAAKAATAQPWTKAIAVAWGICGKCGGDINSGDEYFSVPKKHLFRHPRCVPASEAPRDNIPPIEEKPAPVDPYKALVDDALRKGYKDPVHKALDRAFRFMAGLQLNIPTLEGQKIQTILPCSNHTKEQLRTASYSCDRPWHIWNAQEGSRAAHTTLEALQSAPLIGRPLATQRERRDIVWELRRALKMPI